MDPSDISWVEERLRSLQHEALDHLDRGLSVFKLKPGSSGQIVRSSVRNDGTIGAAWVDATAISGNNLYIQSTQPTDTSNYLWVQTDTSGTLITAWIGP